MKPLADDDDDEDEMDEDENREGISCLFFTRP